MGEEDRQERALRASDADRDRVAERLREALAEGRLSQDEHEDRLGRVYAARTYGELEPVVADLPAGADAGALVPRPSGAAAPAYGGSRTVVGVLSHSTLHPSGRVEGRLQAYAWWGHAEVDLTDAGVPAGGLDVSAVTVMGGIDVHVPAHCRIEVTSIPLMGGVHRPSRSGPRDGPVVRIRAVAFMGGVNVWFADDEPDDEPDRDEDEG